MTRSGYQVRRRNFASVACSDRKGGQCFALGASARSDQYDQAKEDTLRAIVESFQLR